VGVELHKGRGDDLASSVVVEIGFAAQVDALDEAVV
jgi:hypothetical protein